MAVPVMPGAVVAVGVSVAAVEAVMNAAARTALVRTLDVAVSSFAQTSCR
ncbi:MAG: hypothetical protein QOF48_175 [Verrucomicrobiota bacterium]|jgi:hypothetical protein